MSNVQICHRCPNRGTLAGKVMPCTIDGRDIIGHARLGDCPDGRFVRQLPKWEPPADYDPATGWRLDSKGNAGCGCAE